MALDACKPLKMEIASPVGGTGPNDTGPTEVNTLQDALAAAGYFVDGPSASTADKTVLLDRAAGGNLRLTDQATSRLLGELMTTVNGQAASHEASRDLAHLLADEGPGPGLAASGAYCALNYSGPLVTSATWFTSAAMTTKIVTKVLAYPAGSPLPSSVTWTVFSAAGAQLKTLTDVFSYSGPLLTGVSRTWS